MEILKKCNPRILTFFRIIVMKLKKIVCIILNFARTIGVILIIFSFPLILPIMLKLLVDYSVFNDVQDFQNYNNIFLNKYAIIYLIIGILLFSNHLGKLGEFIKETIRRVTHVDMDLGSGKKISAELYEKRMLEESNQNKEISKEIIEDYKVSETQNSIIQDIKNSNPTDSIKKQTNITNNVCADCDKKLLEEENKNLRNFAAYNILDRETKNILIEIYHSEQIEIERFSDILIKKYRRRNNRTLTARTSRLLAENQCESIISKLKFLEIIEISEDNKLIRLTQKGKAFIKEYIKDKEEM